MDAGPQIEVYVERTAFGEQLIDMPLFMAPGRYVDVPFETIFKAARRGVPRRIHERLESAYWRLSHPDISSSICICC